MATLRDVLAAQDEAHNRYWTPNPRWVDEADLSKVRGRYGAHVEFEVHFIVQRVRSPETPPDEYFMHATRSGESFILSQRIDRVRVPTGPLIELPVQEQMSVEEQKAHLS